MSDFTVSILGCGSAVPTPRHNPSCQIVERRGTLYMIDCGEGAQAMMRKMHLPFNRLRHIFISHLHGDHLLGLPGLLSTLALEGEGGTVTIHIFRQGAELLRRVIDFFSGDRSYTLEWNIIDPKGGETIVDTPGLTVTTFRLYHRVDAVGFRFDEKPKPCHIRGDMVEFHNVPVALRPSLRVGADYVKPDGTVIPNHLLTRDADPSWSYAYCSDTMADTRVTQAVEGVTTLYHEATYGNELATKARERGHSTAREAAETAVDAGAANLIIGHYSKRYKSVTPLLDEARKVFHGTVIAADEGMTIDIATCKILNQSIHHK